MAMEYNDLYEHLMYQNAINKNKMAFSINVMIFHNSLNLKNRI